MKLNLLFLLRLKYIICGENMTINSEKNLLVVNLEILRPTQLACGWQEVEAKEWEILDLKLPKLKSFLKNHPIPVVAGPNGKMYLIDRHHMGLALIRLADRWDWEERGEKKTNPYKNCHVQIVLDHSKDVMSKDEFYKKLEKDGMLHPFDEYGQRVEIRDIPMSLADLKNDPYRALAGLARKAGAFEKSTMPYAEFKWADYFRNKIPSTLIKSNIQGALSLALDLAINVEAENLPGYTGVKALGLKVNLTTFNEPTKSKANKLK